MSCLRDQLQAVCTPGTPSHECVPTQHHHTGTLQARQRRKKEMFSVFWKLCPAEEGEEQSVSVPGYPTALDWYSSMSPHFMNNKFLC